MNDDKSPVDILTPLNESVDDLDNTISELQHSMIDDDVIIAGYDEKYYLLYTGDDYYLFTLCPDVFNVQCFKGDEQLNDNPYELSYKLNDVINIDEIRDSKEFNLSTLLNTEFIGFFTIFQDVTKLSNFDAIMIVEKLFNKLADIHYDIHEKNDFTERNKIISSIADKSITDKIIELSNANKLKKLDEKEANIFNLFNQRKTIGKARQLLGNYLNKDLGVIIRKNTDEIYKLDVKANGYNKIVVDDIIIELAEIFQTPNLFQDNDVKEAIGFISDRLTPEYNLVKFNNGVYSMTEHKLIKRNKPIFTLVESSYAFNPDAKPKYIKDFLYSTFKRDDEKLTSKYVKGVLQVIGYLFTSGNVYEALIFLTGVSGAGKTILGNIITAIFGTNNVDDLKFQDLEKDIHATASLVGKHLNIIKDSDDAPIEHNGLIKQLAGNEDLRVNPKYLSAIILPKEEVPKSLLTANNLPVFVKLEMALIERFVVIEFKNKFRNTDDDIKNLDKLIIDSADDMEWLIYHSLKAYEDMINNSEDFILRFGEDKTRELIYKHSEPLNYIVSELILKHDPDAYDSDVSNWEKSYNGETQFTSPYIIANELNQIVIYYAEKEGIEIPLNQKKELSGRKLTSAIKEVFNLYDYVNEDGKKYSTRNIRIDEKQKRIYPELIKSDEYNRLLKELEDNKKATE